MALAQEDLNHIKQEIGLYVKENISAWLAEQSLGKPPVVYEIELRERMVRVEDELKNQRELMREGFNQMDKRFELMQISMDKRFEQVEKRFEQIDKRLEQVDKRLELMQADMDKRFEQVDIRFEQVDKRFEQVDKRFEQVDKRFESVQQDIRALQLRMDHFMRWSFGVTMGTGGLIVGILKLWP
ncbi:hypothetical protein Thiowin_02053 [Thiorhodovibrio winogradskyi]|uniref:Uncharacterized protein n=1 Tax=Thiorhodovibrio winogradskyi TaxID=77007 RepID=A0ABZ0SAH4_9GAMM|nr:hypothetical protein [Thiorhodovibrio winogradskyi]